jgi:hydroxymethylglutaryl-CoA synthase
VGLLSKQAGNRLLLFSYGSGLASSLFTIRVPDTSAAREQLIKCATTADLTARLAARTKASPEIFNKVLQ